MAIFPWTEIIVMSPYIVTVEFDIMLAGEARISWWLISCHRTMADILQPLPGQPVLILYFI